MKLLRGNFAVLIILKNRFMKKIITTILMLAVSITSLVVMANESSEEVKTRIEILPGSVTDGLTYDRSLDLSSIDAFLFPRTGDVEIILYSIGRANVYLVDSFGQIVDYASTNTEIPSTIYLSTNGTGNYRLIIDSDTCYAEGYFTL